MWQCYCPPQGPGWPVLLHKNMVFVHAYRHHIVLGAILANEGCFGPHLLALCFKHGQITARSLQSFQARPQMSEFLHVYRVLSSHINFQRFWWSVVVVRGRIVGGVEEKNVIVSPCLCLEVSETLFQCLRHGTLCVAQRFLFAYGKKNSWLCQEVPFSKAERSLRELVPFVLKKKEKHQYVYV